MYIHNKINDPIIVRVQSKNDDLGNRTLPFNGSRDWRFCSNIGDKTHFYAHFYWKSRTAFFDVFTVPMAERYCSNGIPFKVQRCHWLVREDGFYISYKADYASPHKLHTWS